MRTMRDLRDSLNTAVSQKISDVVRQFSGGQARDYAEYKAKAARAQGLNDALAIIDETFKKLLDEGDDE